MRIFLDDQRQEAHFHLVARRAADEALVYTEPAMIKMGGQCRGLPLGPCTASLLDSAVPHNVATLLVFF